MLFNPTLQKLDAFLAPASADFRFTQTSVKGEAYQATAIQILMEYQPLDKTGNLCDRVKLVPKIPSFLFWSTNYGPDEKRYGRTGLQRPWSSH